MLSIFNKLSQKMQFTLSSHKNLMFLIIKNFFNYEHLYKCFITFFIFKKKIDF